MRLVMENENPGAITPRRGFFGLSLYFPLSAPVALSLGEFPAPVVRVSGVPEPALSPLVTEP
jgi:hypothetical protein